MNPISDPETSPVQATNLDGRRRRKRKPLAGQTIVFVLDGPTAGAEHETVARDFAMEQSIFLLKMELRVGQRIEMDSGGIAGRPATLLAEVTRSRLLSNGRWEIVADHRRAAAAPKPSESQRRHERRRMRLAQTTPPQLQVARPG